MRGGAVEVCNLASPPAVATEPTRLYPVVLSDPVNCRVRTGVPLPALPDPPGPVLAK